VKSANYEEIQMYAKPVVMTTRSLLVAVACALCAGNVAAKDRMITIELHVKADGLDLSQVADAVTFYRRIQDAAGLVCSHANRVDLVPLDDSKTCQEKALGGAIGSIKVPLLTQIYLANHTLQQAATYGIEVPVQIAAK
jgi:UrcA family protein